MAEPDDSSTKDTPGWINGEHIDLKPTGETEDELKRSVDELEPAEESMHELKPAEVRVDELDELSELSNTTLKLDKLSDTTLELSELSDTKDGAGLAAGRNGPCSAQGKIHKKCNTSLFLAKFDHPFLQSISNPFLSKNLNRVNKEVLVVGCIDFFKVKSKFNISNTFRFLVRLSPSKLSLFRWTCASYQATIRNPSFVGLVHHIKQQLKSGSIKRLSAPLVSPFNPSILPCGEFISP
ncbi:hypothetical protein DY000_02058713 [Brassica cretica]|uniref:Uncharacterized protein n=1 Tax=Brassica cretica TaxID=69181 RepID=A0ABQ7AP19_BRACR|nr:hypothetical protein DY000_02058713 [Brassica cretica]